ncbi:MAG: CBS domain-containing protein [Devosia sp.]
MKVAEAMTTDIVTLMPGHSVKHAAQILLDHRVSGAPVVDDNGHLVGILTEGDLLRRVEFGQGMVRDDPWARGTWTEGEARDFVRSHSWRVGDVMSKPVITATEDMSLNAVAALLGTRGIKRLPVLRDGKVVGIVSRADLLKVIAATSPEPIAKGDEAMQISAQTHLRAAAGMFAMCPEVTVTDGVVHLWGKVRSNAERDAARVAVESIPGINGIEDHLTLGAMGPLTGAPAAR